MAGRIGSAWRSLTGPERARVAGMLAAIGAVNVLGWGIFVLEILPRHFHYRGLGVGIGVAVTAWTLGLRHGLRHPLIALWLCYGFFKPKRPHVVRPRLVSRSAGVSRSTSITSYRFIMWRA